MRFLQRARALILSACLPLTPCNASRLLQIRQAAEMRKAGGPSNFRIPVSKNMSDTAM